MMAMRNQLMIVLFSLLFSCAEKDNGRSSSKASEEKTQGGEQTATTKMTPEDVVRLGPALVLLDGKALEEIYKSVFGSNWRAFSVASKRNLGTLNYRSRESAGNLGVWQTTITREYIHELRMALGAACKRHIDATDMLKGASGTGPTAKEISDVMTAFFSYEPLDPKGLHIGAEAYAKAFKAGVALNSSASAINDMRVSLCVAIGQDQRVYLK